MANPLTQRGQREAQARATDAAWPFVAAGAAGGLVGVGLFVAHVTPAAVAFGLLAGVAVLAGMMSQFDADRAVGPTRNRVRSIELVAVLLALGAAVVVPPGWTWRHALSAAVEVLTAVAILRSVGRRHQPWQPTVTFFGRLADGFSRASRRVRWGTLLGGAGLAAVTTATGYHGGAVVAPLGVAAVAVRHWSGASADAQTRARTVRALAGVMDGGEWSPLMRAAQRAPVHRLDLTDDGVPERIVLPQPERLGKETQDKILGNLLARMEFAGDYAVAWDDADRTVTLTLVEPLPTALRWDGSPAREGTIVTIGVGKGTDAHLKSAGARGVGHGQTFPVEWNLATDPHGIAVGTTGSGKTQTVSLVIAQLALAGWAIVGIDPKKVELKQWEGRPGFLKIATELEEQVETLEAAEQEMQRRYDELGERDVNHINRLPADQRPRRMLVVVDEVVELLSTSSVKSDEAKEINELKARAGLAIGSILRLGRAAGVHLLLAGQRADRSVVAGEFQNNLAFKILQGQAESIEKNMIGLGDVEAAPGIPGRAVMRTLQVPQTEVQVAYIDLETDLDRYLPRRSPAVTVAESAEMIAHETTVDANGPEFDAADKAERMTDPDEYLSKYTA